MTQTVMNRQLKYGSQVSNLGSPLVGDVEAEQLLVDFVRSRLAGVSRCRPEILGGKFRVPRRGGKGRSAKARIQLALPYCKSLGGGSASHPPRWKNLKEKSAPAAVATVIAAQSASAVNTSRKTSTITAGSSTPMYTWQWTRAAGSGSV